jgi:RNA-splicing ligase RtcB
LGRRAPSPLCAPRLLRLLSPACSAPARAVAPAPESPLALDVAGAAGLVPGSMGTVSFHTVGRGHPESLRSSSHGAGRLVDEAPTAYRDIRAVMRAQRELTAVRRELRPLVSHKAT